MTHWDTFVRGISKYQNLMLHQLYCYQTLTDGNHSNSILNSTWIWAIYFRSIMSELYYSWCILSPLFRRKTFIFWPPMAFPLVMLHSNLTLASLLFLWHFKTFFLITKPLLLVIISNFLPLINVLPDTNYYWQGCQCCPGPQTHQQHYLYSSPLRNSQKSPQKKLIQGCGRDKMKDVHQR